MYRIRNRRRAYHPAPARSRATAIRAAMLAAALGTATLGAAALAGCSEPRGDARGAARDTSDTRSGARAGTERRRRGTGPALDDFGDTVPAQLSARRIVSLNPATTELLFALGAAGRLVGRSRWDAWPPAAMRVPELGDALRPSLERVIAARPDLVLLYATGDNRAAATALRRAGIPTVALRIDRPADFDRAARLLGRLTGDSTRGALVADSVAATLERVRRATASLPHPTVVWPLAARPPMVAGGGSFLDDLLTAAGARNVYAALPQPSPVVSLEDVARRDPELVLRSAGPGADDGLSAAWRVVPAVRAGRVISVPAESVSRPSVGMGTAAVILARLLHPGLVLR